MLDRGDQPIRKANSELPWLTSLFVRMSREVMLVVCTLLTIVLAEMMAMLLLAVMYGQGAFTSPMPYVLSAAIPAVVAPPLFFLIHALLKSLHQMGEKYQRLAEMDAITGTFNRVGLFDRISTVPARWTVVLADIDDFKSINDEWGHHMGDRALRAFGDRLREMAGPEGLVARTGGDEFVMIVPRATPVRVPNRLQVGVGGYVWARASLGAFVPTEETPIDDALIAADTAMYENKRQAVPNRQKTRGDQPRVARFRGSGPGHLMAPDGLDQAAVIDGTGSGPLRRTATDGLDQAAGIDGAGPGPLRRTAPSITPETEPPAATSPSATLMPETTSPVGSSPAAATPTVGMLAPESSVRSPSIKPLPHRIPKPSMPVEATPSPAGPANLLAQPGRQESGDSPYRRTT